MKFRLDINNLLYRKKLSSFIFIVYFDKISTSRKKLNLQT